MKNLLIAGSPLICTTPENDASLPRDRRSVDNPDPFQLCSQSKIWSCSFRKAHEVFVGKTRKLAARYRLQRRLNLPGPGAASAGERKYSQTQFRASVRSCRRSHSSNKDGGRRSNKFAHLRVDSKPPAANPG